MSKQYEAKVTVELISPSMDEAMSLLTEATEKLAAEYGVKE